MNSVEKSRQKTKIESEKAKVIGLFSCKGGLGKTTTTSNISVSLAKTFWNDVLTIDANLSAPSLDIHLGKFKPEKTIHKVLTGDLEIEEAIQTPQVSQGLDVIYGSTVFEEKLNLGELEKYMEKLKEEYKIILLNSAPGLNEQVISTIKACDEMLIVTEAKIPTVASTLQTFQATEKYKIPIMGTIINKIRKAKYELPIKDIKQAFSWPVLSQVPQDKNVCESTAEGVPIVKYNSKCRAAREFEDLTEEILERMN